MSLTKGRPGGRSRGAQWPSQGTIGLLYGPGRSAHARSRLLRAPDTLPPSLRTPLLASDQPVPGTPAPLPQKLQHARAQHSNGGSAFALGQARILRTPHLLVPAQALQELLFAHRSPTRSLLPEALRSANSDTADGWLTWFSSYQVMLMFELDGHMLPRCTLVDLRFFPGRRMVRVHGHRAWDLFEGKILAAWMRDVEGRLIVVLRSPALPTADAPSTDSAMLAVLQPLSSSAAGPTGPAHGAVASAPRPAAAPLQQPNPDVLERARRLLASQSPPHSQAPHAPQLPLAPAPQPALSLPTPPLSPPAVPPPLTPPPGALPWPPAVPPSSTWPAALPSRFAGTPYSPSGVFSRTFQSVQQLLQQQSAAQGGCGAGALGSCVPLERAGPTPYRPFASASLSLVPQPRLLSHPLGGALGGGPGAGHLVQQLQPLPGGTARYMFAAAASGGAPGPVLHGRGSSGVVVGDAEGPTGRRRTFVPANIRPVMNEVYVPFGFWRDLFNGGDRPFPPNGLPLRVAITGTVQVAEQPALLVRRITPYGYYVMRGIKGLVTLKGKLMVRWSLLRNGVIEMEVQDKPAPGPPSGPEAGLPTSFTTQATPSSPRPQQPASSTDSLPLGAMSTHVPHLVPAGSAVRPPGAGANYPLHLFQPAGAGASGGLSSSGGGVLGAGGSLPPTPLQQQLMGGNNVLPAPAGLHHHGHCHEQRQHTQRPGHDASGGT